MQDCKQIEAVDATAWACALGIAKRSSYFGAMVGKHATLVHSAEEPLRDIVDEFIDFARAGAFVFSLCAEPDGLARSSDGSEREAKSHEHESAKLD